MQKTIRTIDTIETLKIKLEQLNQELYTKEKKLSELKRTGLLKETGGRLAKFTSSIFLFFAIICVIFLLGLAIHDPESFIGDLVFWFYLFLCIAGVVLGLFVRKQAEIDIKKSLHNQRLAEREIPRVEAELLNLKEQVKNQELIIENHIMNQADLITQEIKTISQTKTIGDDTKECPQCAEMIKEKAKICRFCNYKFE